MARIPSALQRMVDGARDRATKLGITVDADITNIEDAHAYIARVDEESKKAWEARKGTKPSSPRVPNEAGKKAWEARISRKPISGLIGEADLTQEPKPVPENKIETKKSKAVRDSKGRFVSAKKAQKEPRVASSITPPRRALGESEWNPSGAPKPDGGTKTRDNLKKPDPNPIPKINRERSSVETRKPYTLEEKKGIREANSPQKPKPAIPRFPGPGPAQAPRRGVDWGASAEPRPAPPASPVTPSVKKPGRFASAAAALNPSGRLGEVADSLIRYGDANSKGPAKLLHMAAKVAGKGMKFAGRHKSAAVVAGLTGGGYLMGQAGGGGEAEPPMIGPITPVAPAAPVATPAVAAPNPVTMQLPPDVIAQRAQAFNVSPDLYAAIQADVTQTAGGQTQQAQPLMTEEEYLNMLMEKQQEQAQAQALAYQAQYQAQAAQYMRTQSPFRELYAPDVKLDMIGDGRRARRLRALAQLEGRF